MSHASYCIKDFEQPSVAADIVVFTIRKTESESYRKLSTATLSVLLVKRKEWPEEGKLALPGGFCCKEETIEETASRKLQEKAGVTGVPLALLCNLSKLGRDERGWIISCGYWTVTEVSGTTIDRENAAWYDIDFSLQKEDGTATLTLTGDSGESHTQHFRITFGEELYNQKAEIISLEKSELAFDHAELLVWAILRLQESMEKPYAAFRMLPERFTLTQLQQIYEVILGEKLIMANFRRKIRPYVEETAEMQTGAGHRPSQLYRVKRS